MAVPESNKRAAIKYQKNHTRQVAFRFNVEYDADILDMLDSVPNKQGYIKNLIRDDIKRRNGIE